MSAGVIITLCILILVGYVFDITAGKTRIPSVILLLALGWGMHRLADVLQWSVPNLMPVLPVLGTIGLVLIVLEGSLELEINRQKKGIIRKSFFVAVVPIATMAVSSAMVLQWLYHESFLTYLVSVLPLCVISSAIAIPTVRKSNSYTREFVTYESSLSDIVGVLLFNFVALNTVIDAMAVGWFVAEIVIMLVVSVLATAFLAWMLQRIRHHIKFVPVLVVILLTYFLAKEFHLPALIFVLVLGLVLGNAASLGRFSWMSGLKQEVITPQVRRLHELITEAAFLVRVLFFLAFGFVIVTNELIDTQALQTSLILVTFIYTIRAMQLWLSGAPFFPLFFIAPRGLITVLLFLAIPAGMGSAVINSAVVIQVVVITALVMMVGMMFNGRSRAGARS
jgi:potassium/hydrogen antiporter